MTSANMRPDILLKSGNYFDFETPETSTFTIEDIAQGLSNTCRFGGQCFGFYSVAQHCVLASQHVAPEYRYDALMHDAAEAFVGDIPSPLKQLLPDYKVIEKRVEKAVFERFGVSNPMPKAVKHIDLVLLSTEQRDLMAPHYDKWGCIEGIEPLKQTIRPWTAQESYEEFLKRYDILTSYGKSNDSKDQPTDTAGSGGMEGGEPE